MNKIITFNVGSSSCKFQIFRENLELIGKGLIERIGIDGTNITYKDEKKEKIKESKNIEFSELTEYLEGFLVKNDVVEFKDVSLMVHRVVNGGDVLKEDIIVTDEILKKLKSVNSLVPLHNPYNTATIEKLYMNYPKTKHVAVFDTTFHATMPKRNFLYALPQEFYTKYKIRRYGAHGSSHGFIAEQLKIYLKKDNVNLISVHLGNGASICAIKDGKSINTTMGFTPLAGLIMGTRTGDIDASIVFHLVNQEGMDLKELETIFNKKSGLLGISEKSSDMRDIIELCNEGDENSILARDMFAERIVNYILSYYNELVNVDGIVFTGGIGENDLGMIRIIEKKLNLINVTLKNNIINVDEVNLISTSDSNVDVYIIPTNEELYMAKIGKKLIEDGKK